MPVIPAIAGESTVDRIDSPNDVYRSAAVMPTATTTAVMSTANWSEFNGMPLNFHDFGGDGPTPVRSRISSRTQSRRARAGNATHNPMVVTSRTAGGASANRLNSTT